MVLTFRVIVGQHCSETVDPVKQLFFILQEKLPKDFKWGGTGCVEVSGSGGGMIGFSFWTNHSGCLYGEHRARGWKVYGQELQ